MTKLPLLVIALLVVGCKGKEPAKQAPPVAETKTDKPSPPPVDTLAAVTATGPKVMLDTVAGVVEIKADGSIMAKGSPAKVDSLAKALELPEIARRRPSAFAADGAAGNGSGSGSSGNSNRSDGGGEMNSADVQFAMLGHPEPATGVPVQSPRVTSAFAIAHPYDVSAGVVVFADANAPATALVDVLATTGGFIAVKRGSELGALPFAFDRQQPPFAAPNRSWLELRLGKPSILALVPGKPMPSDMNNLPEVIKASGMKALDILVAADTKVSDLVASIEMARGAGVESIALGRVPAPSSPEMMTREYTGPRLLAWDFFMQNMDKTDATPFRTAFDATLQPVHDCYTKELAKAKDAGGTAKLELLVETTGKVADLQATGVPKPLAACAGAALGKATFPPVATPIKITAQLAFVPR